MIVKPDHTARDIAEFYTDYSREALARAIEQYASHRVQELQAAINPNLLHDKPLDTPPKPRRTRDMLGELITHAQTSAELEKKTNKEIATLLINHVWAETEIFTPFSDLITVAIDRLKATQTIK